MSRKVKASAPGKVVLSGEYAVLDGAPAIAMAVNRRAWVSLERVAGNEFSILAPGFAQGTARFKLNAGKFQWLKERDPIRVVESVWRALEPGDDSALTMELDTAQFSDKSVTNGLVASKYGIGSSAAITVALCVALYGAVEIDNILIAARRAHADLQGHSGSGVDIACSLLGGLIEYRMQGSSSKSLSWPEGLSYQLVWTGMSSSTNEKLSILDASISMPSRVRLAAAAESMAESWQSGSASRIVSDYHEYIEQLREFSSDHRLSIFAAGHDEIEQAARAASLVYKPCGAGGGDVGIILGTDQAAVDLFAKQVSEEHTLLDVRLSETGANVDESTTIRA